MDIMRREEIEIKQTGGRIKNSTGEKIIKIPEFLILVAKISPERM